MHARFEQEDRKARDRDGSSKWIRVAAPEMATACHLLVAQSDQYFAQAEIKALDKAVAEVRFFSERARADR